MDSQQGRTGKEKSRETKAESFVCKMAAGRNCRQHDKSVHNYVWHYREREKYMQHSEAPGPFRTVGPLRTVSPFRTVGPGNV